MATLARFATIVSRFRSSVLNFLGAYTENGSYLFEKFHFDYEIARLEFNSWGAIK